MASEEELKKINVRSPYFINVTKAVSLGGEEGGDTGGGEEPDVEPTEPEVTTVALSCGDTRTAGVSVGVFRYEISTAGKQIGDYDIDFSSITIPFYAKVGIKGDMPASYTFMAGWVNSDGVWENAVGSPPPSSTTIVSHPDGNSQTLTYTSTQSDIDTYGETVLVELFFPIINLSFMQFTIGCPAEIAAVAEDSGQNHVMVMTIYNESVNTSHDTSLSNKLNGVDASWLTMPETGAAKTYVFGVHTPDLAPFLPGVKHILNRNTPFWDAANHTIVYRPADSINQNTNEFEINLSGGEDFSHNGSYEVNISTHRLETFTGFGRVADEAMATYNEPWNIGDITQVSRLGIQGFSKAGPIIGSSSTFRAKHTFTVNRRGTPDTQDNPNYLESGAFRIEGFLSNGLQAQDQTYNLEAFPEES